MIQTGFESRVKIQDIISNQLPNYILDESPLTSDFLKQYYISQEYQGGPIDLSDNLDQYLKLDNLTPDVIVDSTILSEEISSTDTTITVSDTKGFPNSYGLLKIDNEIITYTEKTSTTFTGCERGFSGITSYHESLNSEELIFSTSDAASHAKDSSIQNLSSLFLKEFYKKTKKTFTPGLENSTFTSDLNAGNFIREAKSLYDTKGTDESFRILFNVLYNETPDIINLEERLIKPSSSNYTRRRIAIAEPIQGNPTKLKGQSIFKNKLNNTDINISISEVEPFVRTGIGTYYKFGLFIDNSGSDEIANTFDIIPNSRVIGNVPTNSSIITVDSTIGFSTSGTLISGENKKIQYTSKTVNQFLGVSNIDFPLEPTDDIRSDDYYYGYEDGDITKEVRLRFTGVLSEFIQNNPLIVDEGQIIGVKNVGDKVNNPENNPTFKEIFANSWIYNSSSSYNLKYDPNQATSATVFSPIDRSSLKYGDDIEIVDDGSKEVVYPTPISDLPYVNQELENGAFEIGLSNFTYSFNQGIPIEPLNLINGGTNYGTGDFTNVATTGGTGSNLTVDFTSSEGVITELIINTAGKGYTVGDTITVTGGDSNATFEITFLSQDDNVSLRRKLKTANSSNVPIQFGNDNVTSDIQNVYLEDDVAYVASNSLPSYSSQGTFPYNEQITVNIRSSTLNLSITPDGLKDPINISDASYSTIAFNDIHDFQTGDKVYYEPSESSLVGLSTGIYYVKKINDNQIKIYGSTSGILGDKYISLIAPLSNDGDHKFTLYSQKSGIIGPQKLLKKFPLKPNIKNGTSVETNVGGIGMLVNGVEINNYKSNDKIHYGPISSISILNTGENYDVINPPNLTLSSPGNGGTTTLIQPVLTGKIDKILLGEQQNFDIESVVSIGITGGNGGGYALQPVFKTRYRDIEFNSDPTAGINSSPSDPGSCQITFLSNHGLSTGQSVVYESIGNPEVGVGIGNSTLVNFSTYYVERINQNTIRLYGSLDDSLGRSLNGVGSVGINTIHLNGSGSGIQKFVVNTKNTLSSINVLDGGNYTNRNLLVKPSGISTSNNSIVFKNHGFNSGELIQYSAVDGISNKIGGLSFDDQYYVLKDNDNSFRLCNAGVGGTYSQNYISKNIVILNSTGVGYQQFKYPDIKGYLQIINSAGGQSNIEEIPITPIVKGSINDVIVYESGSGYGSTILNNIENPIVTIKTGKDAELKPFIFNGKITDVTVDYGGEDYYSLPDLEVIDPTGSGSGAELIPIITNLKITGVEISNTGIGYSSSSSILVKSSGNNVKFKPEIRSLTVNNQKRFEGDNKHYQLIDTQNNLKYTAYAYNPDTFGDSTSVGSVSKLIGWAYDGNPIYGGYGLANPNESPSNTSIVKRMESGYTLDTTKVIDRPSGFVNGYFVDDYTYDNSGDLDEYNGRFEKTVDFPNGTYVYHATIDELDNPNPVFPYFIGNKYRSLPIEDNINIGNLDQLSFDFNTKGALRNTLPYKVSDINADNDFIAESSEVDIQEIEIESISSGSIVEFDLISRGSNYKVNENLIFDNSGTEGNGLVARVGTIEGNDLQSINTDIETYSNSILEWNDTKLTVKVSPHHTFNSDDYITISGISSDLSDINGSYKIGITSFISNTISTTAASPSAGFTTEIYVARIPESVSIGSSIQIGSEKMKILNIFENLNVLRIKRDDSLWATEYPANSKVEFLTNSFEINKKVPYFESIDTDRIYFNPFKSVGVGINDGTIHSVAFNFAGNDIVRNIPVKQLYIENHPFHTNQKVNLTVPSGYGNANNNGNISISTTKTGTVFDLPISNLYIVNKGGNTIGIKTGIGTDANGTPYSEVYFRNIHSINDDNYLLESADNKQVLCKSARIKSIVSISTYHNLTNNDNISLEVRPRISSGIGSDTNVELKRDILTGSLLINPITFSSGNVDVDNNTITLGDKGTNLKTGDKILYSGDATGLSDGHYYYVYKIDRKKIKLCQTYYDVNKKIPNVIDITGTGSTGQTISVVNPQIIATRNTSLVFDHTDSSLSGYEFNIYYDQDFKNKFVGTGNSSLFNVSTNSNVTTIDYGNSLSRLYYNLEKSGFISTSDTDVINNSEILYVDSLYKGDYKITGVGDTDFAIYLNKIPERDSYNFTQCDLIKYTTDSKSASGPIDKIDIISSGSGYKKIPTFVGVVSTSIGQDAIIIPRSRDIGNVSKIRIINQGFEYSSDKTLNPTAYISPLIELKNSNTIGIITVTSGGSNYLSAPDVIVVDTVSKKIVNSGFLEAEMIDNAILDVNIIEKPYGLPDTTVALKTKNNTNGITIYEVNSSYPASDTEYSLTLVTPTLGFTEPPFKVGDKVFIEGIEKSSVDGDGFNSENFGYEFLTIASIIGGSGPNPNPNPFRFTVNALGLTEKVGVAVTTPTGFTAVVPESDYPILTATQIREGFAIGEFITVNSISSEIKITSSEDASIKVSGIGVDDLSVDDVIVGKTSGNKAIISKITENYGKYNIDFSSIQDIGWKDSIGKLNDDSQVIPDNDYYQNLSYSVKSSITWDQLQTPVNNVLHTSGLKNFADTGITSTANVGIGFSIGTTIIRDIIEEKRVDEIQGVDLVRDTEVTGDVARLIEFKNIRLSDYIACLTNDVFTFDNINEQFSNLEDTETYYVKLMDIPADGRYQNIIVRIESNINTGIATQIQLSELVVMNSYPYSDNDQNVLLEKYQVFNSDSDGFVSLEEDNLGVFKLVKDNITAVNSLIFYPKEKFNVDYDLKILHGEFTNVVSTAATVKVGPIDNSVFVQEVTSGSTNDILSVNINDIGSINSFFVNAQIVDKSTGKLNFVEAYVTHNHQDSFISESYIDSEPSILSSNKIGILTSSLDSEILKLSYENDTSSDVVVRTKVVGFGTTGFITSEGHTGVGTYRFKDPSEPDGYERSVIYQGISTSGVGKTTIVELSSSLFNSVKSIVEVSIGSSKAVHEVLSLHDDIDVYVQPAQFLADNSNNLGLGTFGGEYDGNNFVVSFYPDDLVGVTTVSIYNECFYKSIDRFNISDSLSYGSGYIENLDFKMYNAINGFRISKKDFELTKNSIPVFAKKVNPGNSSSVVLDTGTFKVDNHFFRTNQALSYEPKSTIIGIGSTPMQYMSPENVEDTLPSIVYAIKNNDDTFQISTTRSGTAVTFTGIGEGNAHTFSMLNPNEKSIISIDDIVQYPITPTSISHTLRYNDGGQIGLANSTFALSGISTILVGDIIKIDDEYMKVINVGVGTTGAGPITPGIGTFPCVGVQRGSVGTIPSTHTNETTVNRFKGSFNIVDSTLWFSDPPRGNPTLSLLRNGLKFPTSEFNGRAFLRDDYATNEIYDDISDQFNGLTTSFTLTVGGANTIGIGTSGGNGVLFINGIFQTPTTDNNPANNFRIIETGSGATGVTSVIFSGITSTDGTLIQSQVDINRNELPRGGIPVSFGSTTGSGYAPLVGANVRPILDASGSITSIVGVATTGAALGVHTAVYDNISGILTVTTIVDHQLIDGGNVDEVKLSRLGFQCPSGHEGITTTYFPSGVYGDTFSVIGVEDTNKFSVNVGTSTISHTYVGAGDSSGTVFPWYGDLTLGSGYNDLVDISVTVKDTSYEHIFVSAANNAITKTTWNGTGINPTNAVYDSLSGIVTFTATSHGLITGDLVGIATGSIGFTCSRDNHASEHKYPRGPYTHIYNGGTVTNAFDGAMDVHDAVYNASTGDLTVTLDSVGGYSINDTVLPITANSLSFTCSKDGHTTSHTYPRPGDPAYETNLTVTAVGNGGLDVTVNVGASNTKEDPVTGILTTVTKLDNNIFSVFVGSAVGEDANITATPKTVNTHVFDSVNSTLNNCIYINDWTGGDGLKSIAANNGASYDPSTGDLILDIGTTNMPSITTTPPDKVGIVTGAIAFRCNQDDYNSVHKYPRTTDPVNGTFIDITNVNTTTGKITVNVGKSNVNCGGALDFTVVGGGKSYTNPKIFVTEPSYSGLGVTGVSRLGEGATTDTGVGLLVDVEVGAAQTSGIGSGFYEISNFDVVRSGYSFKRGDVFTPIGLVTDRRLYEPLEQASIEVDTIYTDDFTMWQFGEFDFIDSIKNYQDGVRTRFPLFYNGSRISIDADPDFDSDLANVMFVVINGVIQQPKNSYDFIGGASINFTMPLDTEDNVAIFFYKGTDSADSVVSTGTTVYIELGDTVEISGIGTIPEQDDRIVKSLNTSTSLETNLYSSVGINDDTYRPISLIKQKQDRIIDREFISKKRISLEPLILPTAKVINDVTTSDTTFFVDNAHLFDYEATPSAPQPQFSAIIVSNEGNQSIPTATATINTTETTVTSISVTGGSGYTSVPSVSISAPPEIGVGIGTTATATATISNGTVDTITVTEVGLGYTKPPIVLIEPPNYTEEILSCPTGSGINVKSTSGIITGIGTTTISSISGSPLGIKFFAMSFNASEFEPIDNNYIGKPIYVYDTAVGTGLTSMDNTNTNTVGIGTTFVDNIYQVAEITFEGSQPNVLGIITCIIKSDTDTVGIASTGETNKHPVGYYSVGEISGFDRSSSPISIDVNGLTVDVGLTTFPTLQRRGGPGDDTWKQTGGLITPQ